jgi:hypothetical protein
MLILIPADLWRARARPMPFIAPISTGASSLVSLIRQSRAQPLARDLLKKREWVIFFLGNYRRHRLTCINVRRWTPKGSAPAANSSQ